MCGRYTNTRGPEEIGERFGVQVHGSAGTGRYNIAPTEEVLAIVRRREEPEARLLRWGLVPHWKKDTKGAYKMINARLESVATNPTYDDLLSRPSRRALQIADGWYEWLKPEKRGELRQPFRFEVDGGELFAFAALWTVTKMPDGEWLASVTLLTCDARPNEVAGAIHGRMPVVLADRDAQEAWLDPQVSGDEALTLCGALPSARTSATAANPALNRVTAEEGPDLLVAPAR